MRRVLAIGDSHCGHIVGLTPPKWQIHRDLKKVQQRFWGWFAQAVDALRPIDVLFLNGDAVDGKGEKSGGTEIFLPDPNHQVMCAADIIQFIDAKRTIMTYGTPYHTGVDTDYELALANHVGAQIDGHVWVEIDGVTFDLKHKIGSSTIPHGRHTAISKERLWNLIWNVEQDANPLSDVILRSHVHYHSGSFGPDWLGMTLPGLQGPGSKFGVRQCSGEVHFGLVWFDLDGKGGYSWDRKLLKLKAAGRVLKI